MLGQLSDTYIPAVDAEMRRVLGSNAATPDLFSGMIHYHMGWVDSHLEPVTQPAGKRIRPLLCLLCCQAAGGDWRMAVPAAASVEILHNFTLVHDDIQDRSATRRGRDTVWRLWGIEQAINTGDAMFAQAHLAMSHLHDLGVPGDVVVKAIRRLDEVCLELTRGQHADMAFEQRRQVTVEEYLAMIDGKTAALLSLSAELGAMVAGREPETIQHYADFARHLGLAFQVRDDILGIWGDESAIGKSAATDIETRKKSLPVLFGLENEPQLRKLYDLEPAPEEFVTSAVALLNQCGAKRFTEKAEADYTSKALHHLSQTAQLDDSLKQLTHYLLGRQA